MKSHSSSVATTEASAYLKGRRKLPSKGSAHSVSCTRDEVVQNALAEPRLLNELQALVATSFALLIVLGSILGVRPLHSQQLRLNQYAHHAWRTEDDLPGGDPRAIAQTTDGYIWVATAAKLLRFDGVTFTPFVDKEAESGFRGTYSGLFASRDGSLWASRGRELDHLVNGKLIRYERFGVANGFVEDREGTLWVARSRVSAGQGPVCSVRSGALRCYPQLPTNTATSIAIDTDDSIWLGSTDAVLHIRNGQLLSDMPGGNRVPVHQVEALTALHGEVWAGGYKGAAYESLLRANSGRWQTVQLAGVDTRRLSVTVLHLLEDGTLLIGTEDQGIYRVSGSTVDHLDMQGGLSGNTVTDIMEDREHQLWLLTNSGIDKLRAVSVQTFSTAQGLISSQICSIQTLADGDVLFAGYGGVDRLHSGVVRRVLSGRKFPGVQATAMFQDRAGSLWLGVDSRLYRDSDRGFEEIRFVKKKDINMVLRITEGPDGTFWVNTSGSAPNLFKMRVPNTFAPEAAFEDRETDDVLGTKAGIWVGDGKGVTLLKRTGSSVFLSTPRPIELADDGESGIWISTSKKLIHWDGRQSTELSDRNGLPSGPVYGAIVDHNQNLWVSTLQGAAFIRHDEVSGFLSGSKVRLQVETFSTVDGFQADNSPFHPRMLVAADNSVWFDNVTRAQRVDTASLVHNDVVPPVQIVNVDADRHSFEIQPVMELPARTRDIRIAYTALSFVVPAAIHFRYRLEGWDRTWQDAEERREAAYTNLPPGHYTFRVIASNNAGVWNNQGASAELVIAPAFYQTSWFLILLCASILLLSWVGFRLRLRSATRQITYALTTRLRERERISRELHDTLLQGFQGLIFRFQIVLDRLPPTEAARRELEQALELSDQVMADGRNRVVKLRMGDMGHDISQSFRTLETGLRQDSTAEHAIEIQGSERGLQPVIQEELLLLWKEAAGNAFRHSRANRIVTSVAFDEAAFRLSIQDDGHGIPAAILKHGRMNHFGLQGLRERTESIGAKLVITSNEASGTTVNVTLPAALAYVPESRPSFWEAMTRKLRRAWE